MNQEGDALPSWWPMTGFIGAYSYAILVWLCFGVLMEIVRLYQDLKPISIVVLAMGWLIAISTMTDAGARKDWNPAIARLFSGATLIAISFALYLLSEWIIERVDWYPGFP